MNMTGSRIFRALALLVCLSIFLMNSAFAAEKSGFRKRTERAARNNQARKVVYRSTDAFVYNQLAGKVDLSSLKISTPFSRAIDILRNSTSPALNIVVLWRDLSEKAAVERDTQIYMEGLSGIPLHTGLELLLRAVSSSPEQLSYIVEGGVIVIATRNSLPVRRVTRVYDISDLVAEPAQYGGIQGLYMAQSLSYLAGAGSYGGGYGGTGGSYGSTGGSYGGAGGTTSGIGGGGYGGSGLGGGMTGGMMGRGMMGGGGYGSGGYGGGGNTSIYRAQDLMYLIQDTIEPDSWYDYDGEGTITLYPSGLGGGYGGGGYGGTTGGLGVGLGAYGTTGGYTRGTAMQYGSGSRSQRAGEVADLITSSIAPGRRR
jgi:hypothetical protein